MMNLKVTKGLARRGNKNEANSESYLWKADILSQRFD